MKNILFIVIILVFTCCKGEIEKDKKNNQIENHIDDSDLNSQELLYDSENFKDTKKTFSFLNEDYESYKKTVLLNEVFYTATILPKKYYIKKYLKSSDSISHYLEKLKEEEVIQFDFQALDKNDLFNNVGSDNYDEYIKYLSFKIKKDFIAITSKGDTLKPQGVFFERTFKLTPYKRILLYFNFPEEEKNIKLVYYDNLLGGSVLKFGLKKID